MTTCASVTISGRLQQENPHRCGRKPPQKGVPRVLFVLSTKKAHQASCSTSLATKQRGRTKVRRSMQDRKPRQRALPQPKYTYMPVVP
jgi:hypothetical protein